MESISAFDIIKVGIGPSSSHTMGPWEAALCFCRDVEASGKLDQLSTINVKLYGSLAKTGRGHGTDFAVTLGLSGYDFRTFDTLTLDAVLKEIANRKSILFSGKKEIPFENNIEFLNSITLDEHPNGLSFIAQFEDKSELTKTYFSIGGGFIKEEGVDKVLDEKSASKYPCHNGAKILENCKALNLRVSQLIMLNETTWLTEEEVKAKALNLWNEMKASIWRGCQKGGILPGSLKVHRRAHDMFLKLTEGLKLEDADEWIAFLKQTNHQFTTVNKWVSVFALAVNEENASYGRIVTAPTNGAAGVLPAVLMYAYCFIDGVLEKEIVDFILTAGEIGTLFKKSATISAAMGGCQAEIGVSSAMAAGALTEVLGGSPEQVLMAAEIAMEHHLGLTCDPIGGLVQIPCIERNTMGAIKAITASNIAMESDPKNAKVSLDGVIKTMWQTALDMNTKYKETSEGGLATNISVNIAEC
jgi:L-serine dehydratase